MTLEDFKKFKMVDCEKNGDPITDKDEVSYYEVLDFVKEYYNNMESNINKKFFDTREFLSCCVVEDDYELWEYKNGEFIQWKWQDVDDVKIVGYTNTYNKKDERVSEFALIDDSSDFYIFKKY
jgi:hypothetical protein